MFKRTLSNYKYIIILCATLTMAQERRDFLATAFQKKGEYKTVAKNSDFCFDGELTFLNSGNKNDGLRLGQRIFFGPFTKEAKILKESNGCTYSKSFTYTNNSVVQTSSVKGCPKKERTKDSIATQSLTFTKSGLIYISKESKIKCTYEKVKGGQ